MKTEAQSLQDEAPAHEQLAEMLADVLPAAGPQVELSAVWQRLELSRFSGGRIHQNVVDVAAKVWARAWDGGGAAYAITSKLDRASLESVVAEAVASADSLPGTRVALPSSATTGDDPYFASTAEFGPERRTALVASIGEAVPEAIGTHGNIRVAAQTHAVVNNSGLRTGYRSTYAAMNLVTQAEGRATGYGGAIGRDVDQLDFLAAARSSADICEMAQRPVVVPPGDYEVLLDPPAVSMLLVSLGYVGLNSFGAASATAPGAWFAPGAAVGSSALTMVDDPLDRAALFSPIDAEGSSRQRLTLIDQGNVAGAAHDLTTAAANGTATTGHAMPPGDKGPSPHSLAIEPGTTSRADLVAGMKRGLIVTRIHPFVSLRGGGRGELSGTTRDGVFLVENGQIVAPVANVRWSNSMSDVFRGVEAVSTERSVEFMDLPEFSPHTAHVPSLYSTRFTVQTSQPRER